MSTRLEMMRMESLSDAGQNAQEHENKSLKCDDKRDKLKKYYRNYRQRRKMKNQAVSEQLETAQKEAATLHEERDLLIAHAEALAGIYTYSEQVLTTAVFTVEAVRATRKEVKYSMVNFKNWAKHQWVTWPIAADLLTTIAPRATYAQLK